MSGVFNVPLYQQLAGLLPRNADSRALGRGLPDGSGNADPRTGWNVVSDARLRVTGGTSAVAPMYTALWTLVAAQQQRRLGLPHPALYRARGRGFNDVTRGDTGGPYSARTGWDPASGWGSPNGTLVARELQLAMRSRAAPVRELG